MSRVAKIERVKELLVEATKLLGEVTEETYGRSQLKEWMPNRLEFWSRVFLEGGLVTEARAHEIWETEMGKDPRGYGGNFAGKKSSLQYTHDGRVMLTKYATEKCEAWTGKPLEEFAQKFKKK